MVVMKIPFLYYSSFTFIIIIIIIIANSSLAKIDDHGNFCPESKCGPNGPPIRFPFRLKSYNFDPNSSCIFPGFSLSCIRNRTAIELENWKNNTPIFVRKIDYKSQRIQVYNESPSDCLLSNLLSESSNRSRNSPLRFASHGGRKSSYTELRCSARGKPCRTLLVRSDSEVQESHIDVVSCRKVREFDSVPDEIYGLLWRGYSGSNIELTWSTPDCRLCEANGMGCKLKNIGAQNDETECFLQIRDKSKFTMVLRTTTISISGAILLLLVIGTTFYVHTIKKNKRKSDARIEKFLDDYNALRPSRYSYSDIKKITKNLKDVIGEGGYGTVFKGKLSNDIHVAVKILANTNEGNGKEFINEVAMMTQIHHVNVVRLVGYCADGYIRALIFEFLPNDTLEKYILGGENPNLLGWECLYNITLGIARGIEYLHQGCDKRILHFNIKPRNVLLDENFVPKISDFGLAKLCGKDQSVVSMNTARGTMGYIAPEVFSKNFGAVSPKSDVYSFGMLLLEMVGGKKNTNSNGEKNGDRDEIYYPEWIYNLLGGVEDLRIFIEGEDDTKIVKKLAIIGLWCIQWNPIDRPTMKVVVQMLEGGEELTIPPNPFASVGLPDSNSARRVWRRQFRCATIAEKDLYK